MIAVPFSILLPTAGFIVFAAGAGIGLLAGYMLGKAQR